MVDVLTAMLLALALYAACVVAGDVPEEADGVAELA
jgi:hypothetical protein